MYKKIGSVLCIVGAILTMCICCLFSVSAADGKGDLQLICKSQNGNDIPGAMPWSLYRIGSMIDGKIVLEGEFAEYANTVSFGEMSTSDLADAASTLETYAFIGDKKVYEKKNTDRNGVVTFTDVPEGVYLVAAKRHKVYPITFIPSPTIVEIKGNQEETLVCYPKMKSIPTMAGEYERFQVKKVWENDENQPMKPTRIVIDIYRDFELYETVTLSEEKKWTYSWEELSGSDWRIVEVEVPEGCTVIYRNDTQRYVCVNTYEEKKPEESSTTQATHAAGTATQTTAANTGIIGGGEDTTAPTSSEATTPVTNGGNEDTTTAQTKATTKAAAKVTTTTTNKLPQTGQLWWPVPVMAIVGILLIAVGGRLISGGNKEES